jgi:cytoskeletal protein CcmA (bactofilin family)
MMRRQATLNGLLDQGCTVRGEVAFVDLLRVHGHVIGSVTSEAELFVGEGGVIEGEIRVGRLIVAGTVTGTVWVTERLVVHKGGKILAEVHAPKLVMDDGGILEGHVHMTGPGAEPPSSS